MKDNIPAGGAPFQRYTEVTKTITFTSATDAPIGDDDSIVLPVQTGRISRLRIRAGSASHFKSGQQTSGTALINDGTGIAPGDTAIAYDGQVPADAFAVDDYVKIGNEIMLVTADDGSTLTVTRARKDSIATYIDDNAVITKCNSGLRLALYEDSGYTEASKIFEITDVMIAEWVTDAAITATDEYLGLTSDPTVVTDLGIDDLIYIDDTTPEVARILDVFGNVVAAAYDNTIFVQEGLAAHAITKDVERIIEYLIPIPFSCASGTTIYCRINMDEKIVEDLTITLSVICDA